MSDVIQTANITMNGIQGEKTYYNNDGASVTFTNLEFNTTYYWRISYFDVNEFTTIDCTPVFYFSTGVKPTDISDLCPDDNHPHIIDMGKAGMWACCNVGAASPEQTGGYYAWGETEEKSYFDWSTYIHCDGSEDSCRDLGTDIAGTDYDVAHVKWGDCWQMPSHEQLQQLFYCCYYEWTNVNGVNGMKFTCPDAGKIFIPITGMRVQNGKYYSKYEGYHWTSSINGDDMSNADFIWTDRDTIELGYLPRYYGLPVRPIYSIPTPDYINGLCDVSSPHDGAEFDETSVLFNFTINPTWNGAILIRILLSEDADLQKNTTNIDITLKGKVGNPCSQSSEISGLKTETTYYWRMTYYDWDTDTYVNCSPVYSFTTGFMEVSTRKRKD